MIVALAELVARIEAGRSFGGAARPAGPDEWGIVKVSAMTWGQFRPEENKLVTTPERVDPRFEIHAGDLLVSRANTAEYVGAAVLVRQTRPKLLLSDKSLRLVPAPGVNPAYLHAILSSPQCRKQISSLATGTKSSMRNISQQALLSVHVPQPPTWEEQGRIVDVLEAHLDAADRLRDAIERAIARQTHLRRSLLAAAFSGSLVGTVSDASAVQETITTSNGKPES